VTGKRFKLLREKAQNEEGFWAAFIIAFVVTLSLMAIGGSMLIRSEGVSVGIQAQVLKADYATDGAIYYALGRMNEGSLSEGSITIGDVDVSLDTLKLTGEDAHAQIIATASIGSIQRTSVVDLWDRRHFAVWTTKEVRDLTVYDSLGTADDRLEVEFADSVFSMDIATLLALSTAQGHDQGPALFTPPNNYPNGSFYFSGNTPNVTYCSGDMQVQAGRTAYGIYVVQSAVVIQNSASIQGVCYLITDGQTITLQDGSLIQGGALTQGDVQGQNINVSSIRHKPEYMTVFLKYMLYPNSLGYAMAYWSYE
jgi:hypothetical protein